PFSIRLEQTEIINMPALQSFAYATWQGKWLLLGGRIDGLHRRQPWASFDEDGQNKHIYVVDPKTQQVWKQSLALLPAGITEQLQSTNIQFVQVQNKLLLTGGYGYSLTADDHITYPYLTVLKVDEIIRAIINEKPMGQFIKQIKDERMAVTGGRLAKLGDTFLLAGGQRFDGRYNPMGPDHGPGFTQEYTNEIRRFTLAFENDHPIIRDYSANKDSINLHRRDYNLVPQVLSNNVMGYTMFSGVFQYNKNLPFTNFVDIVDGSYKVNHTFNQKYSHYQCAVLPVYDPESQRMYSLFFGGIAQYYPGKNGKTNNDPDVPFTKTISVISRHNDITEESILPIQMPGYLGAAAEFIFAPETKMYSDGIADALAMQNEEILVGYITGGINSSAKNIFWDNSGGVRSANGKLIKVYIKRNR
ncbi:MAG TPA: hypothetical protein VLR49_05310, partial [Ferruginibacter sp.]|nr:hypothetical protein [Ferruginibacter sp.]